MRSSSSWIVPNYTIAQWPWLPACFCVIGSVIPLGPFVSIPLSVFQMSLALQKDLLISGVHNQLALVQILTTYPDALASLRSCSNTNSGSDGRAAAFLTNSLLMMVLLIHDNTLTNT